MKGQFMQCQCLANLAASGEQCVQEADGEDMLCSACRGSEDCVAARAELLRPGIL